MVWVVLACPEWLGKRVLGRPGVALRRLPEDRCRASGLLPRSARNKKPPSAWRTRAESRIVVPPPFAPRRGLSGLRWHIWRSAKPSRANGRSRNQLLRRTYPAGSLLWLRGVVREGQRRCSQPGHRSLRAAKSPNLSPSRPCFSSADTVSHGASDCKNSYERLQWKAKSRRQCGRGDTAADFVFLFISVGSG
jgi:hypothetical protein